MSKSTAKYIYLIFHPHRFIKIGYANNLSKRLYHLQTSSPYELRLIGAKLYDNAEVVEEVLHHRYRHRRTRGEWFDFVYEEVPEVLERLGLEEPEWLKEAYESARIFRVSLLGAMSAEAQRERVIEEGVCMTTDGRYVKLREGAIGDDVTNEEVTNRFWTKADMEGFFNNSGKHFG